MEIERHDDKWGMFGGLTPAERQAERYRRSFVEGAKHGR